MKRIAGPRCAASSLSRLFVAQQTPCLFIAPVALENHRTVSD
jgi:hypothetical protein